MDALLWLLGVVGIALMLIGVKLLVLLAWSLSLIEKAQHEIDRRDGV